MVNEKSSAVGVNIQEKATMIWNVADVLRGPFKPHEYGLVILPMTVVKRFHDCLLPTHDAVIEQYEKVKKLAVIDGFLTRASGYQFYNTSRFTFESLLADPDNIEANFRDYLAGFSGNVQDVLAKFDFDNIIRRMVECNSLYLVIKEFNSPKGYLGPDKISAVDCGYIFEDLVKRFSESFGEEAGAHFTSRDIIYLMTDLLLCDAKLDDGNVTVYDMTMGTSQMLSCMEERIHELNSDVEVTCFGQEFNPSTFAIVQLSTDQFMNTGISTYIWVLCKDKPAYRCGKVQLIDASHCYEQRRKAIGTKRNDISDHCRELIVQAYGEYRNNAVYGDKSGVYCESKIFGSEEFGYNKIVVERPQRDENGEIVMKRGKPVADAALRDTENVPLVQDIDAYFAREVLPYAPDAWIDKSKTKVGYEIPMTRYFYEYQPPEPVDDIVERIQKLEREIADSLNTLFHKEG